MVNVLFRLGFDCDNVFESEEVDEVEFVRRRFGCIINFGGFMLF